MNPKPTQSLPGWETAHRAATVLAIPSPVNVGPYTVQSLIVQDHMRETYAKDGGGMADYRVTWNDKTDGKPRETTVQLYYRLTGYPIPVAFGRRGCDGGELRFASGWQRTEPGKRECITELTDFDGEACLPKSVCAVLRALGFTVSDDNLGSPL
jgi:hypothetical protein